MTRSPSPRPLDSPRKSPSMDCQENGKRYSHSPVRRQYSRSPVPRPRHDYSFTQRQYISYMNRRESSVPRSRSPMYYRRSPPRRELPGRSPPRYSRERSPVHRSSSYPNPIHSHDNNEYKSNTKTIFVGNIPYHYEEPELRSLFEKFGQIITVAVPKDYKLNHNKGICFLEFEKKEAADECVKVMMGYKVEGRPIRLDADVRANRKHIRPRDDRFDHRDDRRYENRYDRRDDHRYDRRDYRFRSRSRSNSRGGRHSRSPSNRGYYRR